MPPAKLYAFPKSCFKRADLNGWLGIFCKRSKLLYKLASLKKAQKNVARQRTVPRRVGRTKGGLNSKLHAICDGQVSDSKGADFLQTDSPDETEQVIGDREYDSNKIRQSLADRNITACIPPKKNRQSKPSYDWHLYKKRHLIENMFAKLKD
ncbi:transposase [Acetobacter orientalis]|uniref:transposase n=1 Tax=Acetobacter orientalis TaxID=146474 RepID=UPI00209D926C|nr:transposase [Acetobacter orientalis]MCP1217624.1 transposase [Acetobacter orientalis]